VRAETDRLTHLARHQATLVNESLWEVRATAHALSDLEASYTSLRGAIFWLEGEKNHSLQAFERRVALQTAIDTAFAAVDEMLEWGEQVLDDVGTGLSMLAMGRLPPQLFSPSRLGTVVAEIAAELPSGWTLTTPLHSGNLRHLYDQISVTTAVTSTGLRIFATLPVVETRWTFVLFRVVSLNVKKCH
jgi:hypothetical protein